MKSSEHQYSAVFQLLQNAGYRLDDHQPHTLGERFLMQNITTASGHKYILLGADLNDTKVVIKVATDEAGRKEIEHERACRTLLDTISFAYQPFYTPEEVAHWTDGPYTISIQALIEQDSTFIERPLSEQFSFALTAFKTQSSARATTASHYQKIAKTFGIRTSDTYIDFATTFVSNLQTMNTAERVLETCQRTLELLSSKRLRIEQYCGFLTHTDFVPHNFRIKNDTMYLLDTASFEFGNKHESWARFLNFMTLYNYKLEAALIAYVDHNYAPEERESLQLMRLYRLIEIITYYTNTLSKSEGDLYELNQARIQFWHNVLTAELENERVRRDVVEQYRITRDRLRSQEEKQRQKNLH